MKKVLCLFAILFVSATMFAGHVTKQQALQKAQRFMKGKKLSVANNKAFSRGDSKKNDVFYIFNAENDGGFVIVSGDDRTVEILGYSDKGTLDLEDAPEDLKWVLEGYLMVLDSLSQVSDLKAYNPMAKTRGAASKANIEPLVKTQWGQHAPYNGRCPEKDGERCATGCVATAMAQIINYNKWPQGQTNAVDAYTTSSLGISMPKLGPTTFDWDNMTNDDIARLILYCGQSLQMDYNLGESGSEISTEAFKNIFKYSKKISTHIGIVFPADRLEQLVYDDLAGNHPVLYTGQSSIGRHAFVVDGYKDGLFHINWGWDGDDDGYFVLTGLTEDVMPFPLSFKTEVVFGIGAPAVDASHSDIIVTRCWAGNRSVYRKSSSDDFIQKVTFDSDLLCDFENVTCNVGYGLYDDNGLVKVFAQQEKTFPMEESYSATFIWGKDIPIGTYHIIPVYRHGENDDWKKMTGNNVWQLAAHVGEKSLYFKAAIEEDDGNYEEYGAHEIDGVTYKLSREFGIYWAYILPYQLTGKYSGSVTIPNKVEYEGITYLVREDLFSPLSDCENLTSLSLAPEWRIILIDNCPNLAEIEIKQGESIAISNCPLLESVEFPVTTKTPLIENCLNLKTIKINCKALQFDLVGQANWSDESLPSLTDVYFPSMVPPVLGGEGNVAANSHAKLHVKKGSLAAYQDSQWKLWDFVEDLPADGVTFGYSHSEAVSNSGMTTGTVSADNNDELAMRIPAKELQPYIGCQITNIQVYSPERVNNDKGYETYEYAFITKPGTDYIAKIPFEVIRGAWNTIELDEPYTITGEDLFVGIGRQGQIGIRYEDESFVADALWRRIMGNDDSKDNVLYGMGIKRGMWDYVRECCMKEEGPSASFAHPWPIKVAIEGESVPQGVVIRELDVVEKIAAARSLTRASGNSVQIKGTIRNRSSKVVKSYTVEWSIDGGEKQIKTFETLLYPNDSETIAINLPSTVQSGNHSISAKVTFVNNAENGLKEANMPTIDLKDGNVSFDSLYGDVNCDGDVNETDLIETANYIMGTSSDFFFTGAADMNEDQKVNAADIVLITNVIK